MTHPIVRTALFVPASRPERIPAGQRRGRRDRGPGRRRRASGQGQRARSAVRLPGHASSGAPVGAHQRRRHALARGRSQGAARQAGVTAILLPKAESLAQARHAAQTGLPVIPIIETARGVLNLAEVAATPGVARLAGSLDYALDLGLSPDSPGAGIVLDHARIQVLQTRAAGLPPALDGCFPACRTPPVCARSVQGAADGLWRHALHPSGPGAGDPWRFRAGRRRAGLGAARACRASRWRAGRVHAGRTHGGRAGHRAGGRCWRKRASRYSARACRPVGVRIWGETRRGGCAAWRPGAASRLRVSRHRAWN